MKIFSKSERKILISLLSILIILCSLAYFSHRNSNRVLTSAEQVDNSQEIKYHIEQLLTISTDLEVRARGYVITGDEQLLESADKATLEVFDHISHLKKISAENPAELSRINELESLVEKKVSNSNRTIWLRRNEGMDAAVAFFSAGEDKMLMDKIRSVSGLMLRDEDILLHNKKDENKEYIKSFNLTFDLLLVKIAISIIAIFFVLKYYFKQRRKSDELLRENKELLQNVIDNTSSVIFIKDLEGKYLLINTQFEKLFHVSKENIKGKADHELFLEEVARAIRAADLEVIRNKRLMEFEEDVPNNGEMHHYISIKFPLFDENENVYAVCGIATDITERKQSVEMLKASSDAIMDLFNNAPSGYHSVSREGLILEMNETELNWLGYKREEIVGKVMLRDLLDFQSKAIFDYHFPRMRDRKIKSISDVELKFRRKDGSYLPVIVNVRGIYNAAGELVRTRTSAFDISFRKQVETIISQN